MRGFVASWFFPPATSSEGLVTFKLLKYSKHQYDVCCSSSKQWSYNEYSRLQADNIAVYPVNTENISDWVNYAIRIFEEKHKEYHYDFIMTRSMPPESILVGLKIKQRYPELAWFASFADPIFRNPYEIQTYINEDRLLSFLHIRNFTQKNLNTAIQVMSLLPISKYKLLNRLRLWEKAAFTEADMLIFPSSNQCRYSLSVKNYRKYSKKCNIVPHSFDEELYSIETHKSTNKKMIFSYIGYADNHRSLKPLIRAVKLIYESNKLLLSSVFFQLIGNIPSDIKDMIYAFQLQEIIEVKPSVSYLESLKIMQESDWLFHIDADFSFLENGSIFFASKIADYIGSKTPIIGMTKKTSTAGIIIKRNNGIIIEDTDASKIAKKLTAILKEKPNQISLINMQRYSAKNIAKKFDITLLKCINNRNET